MIDKKDDFIIKGDEANRESVNNSGRIIKKSDS